MGFSEERAELEPSRSAKIYTLLDGVVLDAVATTINSAPIDTETRRMFLLYLNVDSTGTGAHILQAIVQFSDDGGETWYDYLQGPFAALYFEDVDTASGVKVCFSGVCAGRDMRVQLKSTSTSATLKFTVTAKAEFWQ
jgi:hypothetical protein